MSTKSLLTATLSILAALVFASPTRADSFIFWGEYDTGRINRANLDGSGVTTIATGQNANWGVAADQQNQRVYFAPYGSGLRGVNFDGTGLTSVQTLVTNGEGVAVNNATGEVYFNYYTPNGSTGNVGNGIDHAAGDGSDAPSGATHL